MKEKKKKRAKPFPANKKSKEWLESRGWTTDTVEQTLPYGFIKRDCFGFADILAMKPSGGLMLVQATGGNSRSNFKTRIAKVKAEPRHLSWLASGGRIQVHNWEGTGNDRTLEVHEITNEET